MNKGIIGLGIAGVIIIVSAGAAGAIVALNSESSNNTVAASKEQPKEEVKLNRWQQKNGDWYYYKDDISKTGWVQDNGNWYYLGDSGKMKLNWLQDKNSWYYLGTDGKMRTGWIKDNGNWYYLNDNGTMAANTTIDGYYLNDKGLIEDTPSTQKQNKKNNTESSNADKQITIEYAKNLIYKNIDAKDKAFLIDGQTSYLTEVTPNTNDYQAQKIYKNLGVNENMYKFQANYNSAFFVCKNTGTTYLFDAGGNGKIGCGLYLLKNGTRAETWRIGFRDSSNVVHSYNGEDWAQLY